MNCETCQARLTDHCRDAVAADLATELAAHLQHCASCRQAYVALQQINALLDRDTLPSTQLRQHFLARLQRETRPAPRRFAALFQAWWPSRPLGAFSYSAALLLCGVISGQWLPLVGSAGMAAVFSDDIPRDRLVQLCAVPPASVELL